MMPPKLGISDSLKFGVHDGKVILPFVALNGIGGEPQKLCIGLQ